MKRKKKILVVVMIICMLPAAVFASVFSDMPNDWSTSAIQNAINNSLLSGDSGKIMSNDNLTRAQMATIINRAFGATEKASLSSYTDVAVNAWFYGDMEKAVQMKTFNGSGQGKMNPEKNITRQEAFVVLANAFKLSGATQTELDKFSDKDLLSAWAKDSAASLIAAEYVGGSNGKLNPKQSITRADFAQFMDNILKNYIKTAGTYTKNLNGNVMINVPNVTLKDMTIKGDLIIGDGVGDGDVTLESVVVTGRIVVRGGGLNSIKIIGESKVQNIVIARIDGKVRVYVADGIQIGEVIVDGSDDVTIEGNVGSVTVTAPNVIVTATSAQIAGATISGENSIIIVATKPTIKTAVIEGKNAEIRVLKGSKIEDVTVNSQGSNSGGRSNDGSVNVPVSSIDITSVDDATTMVNGGTLQISAIVTPVNATNKTVIWSITNGTGTATIDANGLLTATGAGTVTIKATTNDGLLIFKTKVITISNQLVFTSATNNDKANDNATLGVVGTIATSSADAVATAVINNSNIDITSVSEGSAIITVKDGANHEATIEVTVAADGKITIGTIIKYEVVFQSKTDSTTANDVITLGVEGVTAISSDMAVATAAINNGKIDITSVSEGSATITVKKISRQATIKVTVATDGTITIVKITRYINSNQ